MSNVFNRINRRVLRHPRQIRKKHHKAVKIVGRIGFFTKAFIYATIGGLTLQSVFTSRIHNESPQGVFILFGSFPNGTGYIMLIMLLVGVCIYVTWRLWEGISGQGYDPRFSKKKNFFRYRISPLASGFVYLLYAAYIIYLFTLHPSPPGESLQQRGSCFPVCWKSTTIGQVGIGLLATSFTIATITQLIPALTGNFRKEMDHSKFKKTKMGKAVKVAFFFTGHIGFLARALLFFLVCLLFWKVLLSNTILLDPKQSTVAQAINALRDNKWGEILMATLGIGLIIYGLFASMCTYFKIFPTPPPSTNVSDTESMRDANEHGHVAIQGHVLPTTSM